ncbi:hypothetical protein NLY10_29065 [Streptomyces sp. MAR25Y5]|nr:hypothetical protein [Streptomyces sp. MAR25Y5]
MLWILIGEMPLQARENLAYASQELYQDFGRGIRRLNEEIRRSISEASTSLPKDVGAQYVRGLSMLTDDGGVNHLDRMIDQLDEIARGQVDHSMKIQAAKWEIIAEIVMLLIELALLAALAAITGGTSLSQMALARARSRLAVLLIVQRLLRMSHLAPALTEAMSEALQTLAVRLAQIVLNSGDRKPHGIDWKDVGKAAAFGALVGALGSVLEFGGNHLKNWFKNSFDNFDSFVKKHPHWNITLNGAGELGGAFVVGAVSESVGEYLIQGAFEGDWDFEWETFVGSGTSSMFDVVAGGAVAGGALWLHNKFNTTTDLGDLNDTSLLDIGGNGGSSGSAAAGPGPAPAPAPGPLPTTTTDVPPPVTTVPSPVVSTPLTDLPAPVSAYTPPVHDDGHDSASEVSSLDDESLFDFSDTDSISSDTTYGSTSVPHTPVGFDPATASSPFTAKGLPSTTSLGDFDGDAARDTDGIVTDLFGIGTGDSTDSAAGPTGVTAPGTPAPHTGTGTGTGAGTGAPSAGPRTVPESTGRTGDPAPEATKDPAGRNTDGTLTRSPTVHADDTGTGVPRGSGAGTRAQGGAEDSTALSGLPRQDTSRDQPENGPADVLPAAPRTTTSAATPDAHGEQRIVAEDDATGQDTGARPDTDDAPSSAAPVTATGTDTSLSGVAPAPAPLTGGPGFEAARSAAPPVTRSHVWADPVSTLPDPARPGETTQYTVRSHFDARRFEYDGQWITDLTVRVTAAPDGLPADVWDKVRSGVETYFNAPGHHLADGDLLHVTVEQVPPGTHPGTLDVDFVGRDRQMTRTAWWADADPIDYAREIARQLGLRDETRAGDPAAPQRPGNPGSLLGDYTRSVPDGPAQGGLALLSALVGDLTSTSPERPATGPGTSSGRRPVTTADVRLGAEPHAPRQPQAATTSPLETVPPPGTTSGTGTTSTLGAEDVPAPATPLATMSGPASTPGSTSSVPPDSVGVDRATDTTGSDDAFRPAPAVHRAFGTESHPASDATSAPLTGPESDAGVVHAAPSGRLTPEVTARLYRAYADHLFRAGQDAQDFDSVFYAFVDEQDVIAPELAWHPRLRPQMARFHDELMALRAQRAATATPVTREPGEPMRLYRKMSRGEAEQMLAGPATSGIGAAMAYNRSDQYRKYFTSSLSHTSVFSNANAASDDEVVVEFILPWDGYWGFVARYGTPNQQPGAYQVRDSALVHQERLRTGAAANFHDPQDVTDVVAGRTHHNIGIGHGNAKAFAGLVTGRRVVPAGEVDAAAQAAADDVRAELRQLASGLVDRKLAAAQGHGVQGEPFGPRDAASGGAVSNAVVAVPEAVQPPASQALVTGLSALPTPELLEAVSRLSPEHRRWLATQDGFIASVRDRSSADEFAQFGARLLVVVPGESARPVSARWEAYAQLARMLQDPDTVTRLLTSGAAVIIVPQDVPLGSVSSFAGLHGPDSRGLDDLRGAQSALVAAVAEENLLGETTPVGPVPHQPEGYSSATHEIAHLLHTTALTDTDRHLIHRTFQAKRDAGHDAPWPDGVRRDLWGMDADNYSSTDEFEYFAQLSNAYLGTNHGHDTTTGRPRNNGAPWVRENEPDLLPLLQRLYGTDPHTSHTDTANPVTATTADNARYEAFRDFMTGIGEATDDAPAGSLPESSTTGAHPDPAAAAGTAAPLHPAPGERAGRITVEAMEAYYRVYAEFFDTDDAAADFASGYYVFADSQAVFTDRIALHDALRDQLGTFHAELVRIRDAQAAAPTPMTAGPDAPLRLYRKMATAEARVFLGARTPQAGFRAAMAHNDSRQYRKFFTTSLSHTSAFTNDNAASDDETVVEFTLPQDGYWRFVRAHGVPNQQTGAYQIAGSALLHQELLRTGAAANFRSPQDVDAVLTGRTHHNIGIGHGNENEFARLVTGVREVSPAEVDRAVRDARTAARAARRPHVEALVQQRVDELRRRSAVHAAPAGTPAGQVPGLWPEPLSSYVTGYGAEHDGHVGLVHVEPLPAPVVDGLHRQVLTALGVTGPVADDHPVLLRLRSTLTAEKLARELPYVRSSRGARFTVEHEGRERTVDVRLGLREPVRSGRYGAHSAQDPEGRVERRGIGSQESASSSSSGTFRTVPVTWTGLFPRDATGPVRRLDAALALALTHNQYSATTTVTHAVQTMTAQRSSELSQPVEFATAWQVRVDPPAQSPAGGWDTARTHGPVTVWFPEHLAAGHDGELAVPAGLDDLPVWGVDTVREPARLLAEVRRDFATDLARLSDSSTQELEAFLSEPVLRGTLPLQRGGGLFSPVLLDRDGNAIGMLKVTTEVEPGDPTHRSLDGKINLESHLAHSVKVDSSVKLTSGAALDGSFGPAFTGDHAPGHPDASSVVSGSLVAKGGAKWQTSASLSSGGSATITHSVRSNLSHLLVPARVTHRVTLIRARGGSTTHRFGPWDDGMRLRILAAADARGTAHPPGSAPRQLPEELENLHSLGVSAAPLEVSGTEPLFERAEAWLRREGFLPPLDAVPGALFDEAAVQARLANLRRFEQARSGMGLRASTDGMLDGGHAMWFDLPDRTGGTRRVHLRLSAFRDTGPGPATGVRHRRTLPDVQVIGISSFSVGGTETTGYAYGWQAGFGGGPVGPLGDRTPWTLGGSGDYTYARQTSHVSTVGSGVNQDQFFIGSGQPTEIFDVPAQFALDLYEGPGDGPAVRFADPASHPDATPAKPADIERPAEPAAPAARTVGGHVTLAVPQHRTVPADTPRQAPPAHRVRAVNDTDRARLALTGPDGKPVDGVVRLPDDAVMDVVRGSGAILDAFRQIVTNTYPGHPEQGLLDTVRQTVAAYAPGALATIGDRVSGLITGPDATDQGAPFTEVLRGAVAPAALVGRGHQIFKGGYVVEGLTLPGLGADHEFSVEIQGYLHDAEHLHSVKQYLETDVGTTDTAQQQVTTGASHQGALSATTRQMPPEVPAGTPAPAQQRAFNPSARYVYGSRTDETHTLGSSTAVTRTPTESGTQHRVRSSATLLVTVRHGRRNLVGNMLGLTGADPVTVAVDLPRGAQFLLSDQQLARDAAWFTGLGTLTPPARPEPALPLPDRFARTQEPGYAGILSVRQLGDDGSERRDRIRAELTALVEREAPGSTTPGHASYLPGVAARIADLTTATALRALPGRGPRGVQRFHFRHLTKGGARLVEVELSARPRQDAAALRTVRGRPAGSGTGQEQVHTHAPANTSDAVSHTRRHAVAFNPTTRYLRPTDDTRTDRTGPALGFSTNRTDTAKTAESGEDRFWLRTDNAADFEVDYEYTATVRSELVKEWPFDVPGGVIEAGVLAWYDENATFGTWLDRLLHGRPAATTTVPARVTLRFTGSEAADPVTPPRPTPPSVSAVHPLRTLPTTAGQPHLADGQRIVPTGPTPVFHFNGYAELAQALATVAPRTTAHWRATSASGSAEGAAVRIGELIQAGTISLDPPRSAGITQTLPGTYPEPFESDDPPRLHIELRNPRRVTDAGDVALDRLRLPTAAATTSLVAGSAPAGALQMAYERSEGQVLGTGVPLVSRQPINRGQVSATAATRREWFKTGGTALPAEGRGTRSHETMADVVITVSGPGGTLYVTGSAELRLTERDVLGYGITDARTDPRVYDLRSLLAGQSAADLRDWTTHPLGDLPQALADGLHPSDPAAQFWLAIGPDPDGALLARALYAASRTAVLADRPVEMVLRTDEGLRHWRFTADGALHSTDAGTLDAWTGLGARITTHADAFRAQREARQRESDLRGPQAEARTALDTAEQEVAAAGTARREATDALTRAEEAVTTARSQRDSAESERDHWQQEARRLRETLLDLPRRISDANKRATAASGEVRAADAVLEHIARQAQGTVSETRVREAREHSVKAHSELRAARQQVDGLRADQKQVQGELDAARRKAEDAAGRLPELEKTLADAESAAEDAVTALTDAAERLDGATRHRDDRRTGLRDLNRSVVGALKEQSEQADVQSDVLLRLPGLAQAVRDVRRATTEGLVSVPLSSLASVPAQRPGGKPVLTVPKSAASTAPARQKPAASPQTGVAEAAPSKTGETKAAPSKTALKEKGGNGLRGQAGDSGKAGSGTAEKGKHSSAAPPATGRPLRTIANGECLLYSVLGSAPRVVRDHVPGLATAHPDVFDWLSDTGRVRAALARRAQQHSETGTLPPDPLAETAVAALRDHVANYLRRTGPAHTVPYEVTGQLRQSALQEFADHLEGPGVKRTDLLKLARWHRLGDQNVLSLLPDDGLRTRLKAAYPTSTAPLDEEEQNALLDAVKNWGKNWDTPFGETFLPLTAHALGVTFDVALTRPGGRTEVVSHHGPRAAGTNHVEIHYNGVSHYSASDAVPASTAGGLHAAPSGRVTAGLDRTYPFGPRDAASGGAVSNAVVAVPEAVQPPASQALVTGLSALPTPELLEAVSRLSPEHRRWLATQDGFIASVRDRSSADEFAQFGARLLVVVPGESARPVSARWEAYAQLARMLQDPDTVTRLLTSGAAVIIVPQDVPLGSVSSFAGLHGPDSRGLDDLRGAQSALVAAVAEENLLGETTPVGPVPHQPEGYSSATHEIAHLLHTTALTDTDRHLIHRTFQAKRDAGHDAPWPDGVRRDLWGMDADNYSSTDEFEYFAQLSNAYLGTNHGHDTTTGRPRNNGAPWVRENEPDLLPLLQRLYGTDPHTSHTDTANPVTATTADNAVHEAFRDFMTGIGESDPVVEPAVALPGPQTEPHEEAGAPAGLHAAPSGPAKRVTADVMEAYFQAYAEFFETDGSAADFGSGYYVFAYGQDLLVGTLAAHDSMREQMRPFHDRLVRIREEQAASPTPIDRRDGEPMRLYRKMSAAEAAQFLGARDPRAAFTAAMAYNRSVEYRKFFTTSLSHTSVFSNANAASDDERVLEFTLPWDGYWNFIGSHGTPNQQAGAYQIRDSALVHQERLRTGAAANFRTEQDVAGVLTAHTHHNVGIGHGNQKEFARLVTGVREVTPQEVERAARDAADTARQARRRRIDAVVAERVAPLRRREAATVHAAPAGAVAPPPPPSPAPAPAVVTGADASGELAMPRELAKQAASRPLPGTRHRRPPTVHASEYTADAARDDRHMLPNAQDLELLHALRTPGDPRHRDGWEKLTPGQSWALLAAEQRGEMFHERDRAAFLERIGRFNDSLRTRYPVDDPELMATIAQAAHDHVRRLPIASDFDLAGRPEGAAPRPDGTVPTRLVAVTSDTGFRSFWATGSTGGTPSRAGRGWVEELQGYAAALRRVAGAPGNGPDGGDSDPPAPDELPKYAALVPPSQKGGTYSYGSAVVHWKDSVRGRATHTPGGSADAAERSVLSYTDNAHVYPLLAYGEERRVRLALAEATRFRYDPEMRRDVAELGHAAVDRYFETQIHGELSWTDVDRIVLNWGDLFGSAQRFTTRAEAESMVAYLCDFAARRNLGLTVEPGREIGSPGGAERLSDQRLTALYDLEGGVGDDERELGARLDRLAAPAPFLARADDRALLALARSAGIGEADPARALALLWQAAERARDLLPAGVELTVAHLAEQTGQVPGAAGPAGEAAAEPVPEVRQSTAAKDTGGPAQAAGEGLTLVDALVDAFGAHGGLPVGQEQSMPVDDLDGLGVTLTSGQRAQAVLLGGSLPVRDLGLTPAQYLRRLLTRGAGPGGGEPGGGTSTDPADGAWERAVAAAADALGVEIVVVAPDGHPRTFGVDRHGTVRLFFDGMRYFVRGNPS